MFGSTFKGFCQEEELPIQQGGAAAPATAGVDHHPHGFFWSEFWFGGRRQANDSVSGVCWTERLKKER
jgi:hypothetical protein